MRTVWKFPLNFGMTEIEVGADARVVHVGLDPQDAPRVWVEHTHPGPRTTMRLSMVGTGYPVEGTHVGTFFDGPFVWHVYKLP